MPRRLLEEERFFGSGKPVLRASNQASAQTSSPSNNLPIKCQAQGSHSMPVPGKDGGGSVSGSVKSLRWVDPVSNPVLRGYIEGKYNPTHNLFGNVRNSGTTPHQGFDILAEPGTPVYAVRDGVVAKTDENVNDSEEVFGKSIELAFETVTGITRYAFYGHLSEIKVDVGDEVKAGTILGCSGFSGNASGVAEDERHLHFGIAKVLNPGTGLKDWENPIHYMGYIKFQEEDPGDSESPKGKD